MPPALRRPGVGALLLLALLAFALLRGSAEEEGERDARQGGERGGRAGRETGGSPGRGEAGEPGADAPGGIAAPVVDVVDGDTIEVELEGEVEDVRYIGVDTPESVAPGQPVECFGERASDFNSGLVAGEEVRLVFDAERRDRYDRLLAYVYVGELFVNAELIREGFARTLTIAPNDSFAGLFARLEQEAGREGRGLWSACGP